MIKALEYIELTLENCESIFVDKKDIIHFYIGDITENLFFDRGCDSFNVGESQDANFFTLTIPKGLKYKSFNSKTKYSVAKRLKKWRDITQITLHYDNDKEASCFVPYMEEDPLQLGSPNKLMRVKNDIYYDYETEEDIKVIVIEIGKNEL